MLLNPRGERKPEHLCTLSAAPWPEAVKEDIAQQFRRIGVEDPFRQKLVEPYAYAFGGDDAGLDGVNWEMVMDYFRWEASAWDIGDDAAKEKAHRQMVRDIKAKYGGMFHHHAVYSSGRYPYC